MPLKNTSPTPVDPLIFKTHKTMKSKLLTLIMCPLVCLIGASLVFSEGGKKDDKKDKKDKGHQGVVIIIWEPAWSPVTREISLTDFLSPVEESAEIQ